MSVLTSLVGKVSAVAVVAVAVVGMVAPAAASANQPQNHDNDCAVAPTNDSRGPFVVCPTDDQDHPLSYYV